MKLYLDLCALKRPFDDQSQGRIWLESQAVTRILRAFDIGALTVCNSAALEFENLQNPNPRRRARTAVLLAAFGKPAPASAAILLRAEVIQTQGFGDLDALHIAFAEFLAADYFVTTDDDALTRSREATLRLRVINPVALAEDLNL